MGCNDYPKASKWFPPPKEDLFASLKSCWLFTEFRSNYGEYQLIRITLLENIDAGLPQRYLFEGVTSEEKRARGKVFYSRVSSFDDSAELEIYEKPKIPVEH